MVVRLTTQQKNLLKHGDSMYTVRVLVPPDLRADEDFLAATVRVKRYILIPGLNHFAYYEDLLTSEEFDLESRKAVHGQSLREMDTISVFLDLDFQYLEWTLTSILEAQALFSSLCTMYKHVNIISKNIIIKKWGNKELLLPGPLEFPSKEAAREFVLDHLKIKV